MCRRLLKVHNLRLQKLRYGFACLAVTMGRSPKVTVSKNSSSVELLHPTIQNAGSLHKD